MKQRYDSYKPSGIDWIGDIPSHWDCVKTLFALSMPITDGPHETPTLYEDGIPFISAEAISTGEIRFDHMRGYISQSYYEECCKKYIPQRNDIYMTKSGASTGRVALVETDCIFTIWSPLAVFRSNSSKTDYKFLYYVLLSECYQKQVENGWSYGTQQNIGMRTLEKLKIPFPPLSEQEEIVAWLDEKCSEIDAAIAKVDREIELIDELKQSEISRVVTRGLNPDAPLRPSGIDWIGEIPSHWRVIPMKRDGTMNTGLTFTKADLIDSGDPVVSYGQVHSEKNDKAHLNPSLIRFIPKSISQSNKTSIVSKGSFIFADTSEDLEGCGNAVYVDTDEKIYAGYHTIIFKRNDDKGKYLAYLFQTDAWRSQIRSQVSGVKVYSITQAILSSVSIIVPPLLEQQAIADFLDKKCAEIDGLKEKLVKKREILKELRQSIISEVVTGKRKVI